MDDSYIIKLLSVLILTTLPVNNQQMAVYRSQFTIGNVDTILLDECSDEVIQPVLAFIYEEDGIEINTVTACYINDYFKEMCYAEAVCSIPKHSILEQRRTTCSSANLPLIQFRYNCIPTASFNSISDLHVALRGGTLTSPNFPDFHSNPVPPDDGQESMLRCTLSRDQRGLFKLQNLHAWVTLNGSGESGQFTVEAVGLDNSPRKVESNTETRQFLNITDFEAQELEQLNLTFRSAPANAKFILEFTATEELIVCCSHVNETNEWPDCRGEVMNKKDKQADVKGVQASVVIMAVLLPLGAIIILLVLVIIISRKFSSRKKKNTRETQDNSESPENGSARKKKSTLNKSQIGAPIAPEEDTTTPALLRQSPPRPLATCDSAEIPAGSQSKYSYSNQVTEEDRRPVRPPRSAVSGVPKASKAPTKGVAPQPQTRL